jgi:Putative adhesin
MQRVLSLLTLVMLVGAAAPAGAQDSAVRVVSVTRLRMPPHDTARGERAQRGRTQRESQTERFTKTVTLGANGELDVSNISGDIVVTRGSGGNATIEVVKTASADSADAARELLPLVQVDIIERGGRVEVRTRYPQGEERRNNRRNINVSVAYTITAPEGTRLKVKSISGNVSVRDIAGELSLESISGTIRIAGGGRLAKASSISGDVEIADTKIDGAVEAGTISGTLTFRRVTARSLSLNSVSGNVVIEDVTCSQVDGQTISGQVRYTGELSPNGRYEFTSHSGEVRLALGGNTGFQLEATSFSGSVQSDLPITLSGSTGGGRRRAMRGTHGDGSAVLELTTFSGSIAITKR